MNRVLISRKEAEKIAGVALVRALDDENAQETGVVQHNETIEFSASMDLAIGEDDRTLIAYYYQPVDSVAACEDLGDLSWEIEGYEII